MFSLFLPDVIFLAATLRRQFIFGQHQPVSYHHLSGLSPSLNIGSSLIILAMPRAIYYFKIISACCCRHLPPRFWA